LTTWQGAAQKDEKKTMHDKKTRQGNTRQGAARKDDNKTIHCTTK
jgi:hypothetical protein